MTERHIRLQRVFSLLLLFSIAEGGSHRGAGLSDVHALFSSILRLSSRWDVLRLNKTLVFVTPEYKVKEIRNEGGRDIVGGTMLCPAWENDNRERYITFHM